MRKLFSLVFFSFFSIFGGPNITLMNSLIGESENLKLNKKKGIGR